MRVVGYAIWMRLIYPAWAKAVSSFDGPNHKPPITSSTSNATTTTTTTKQMNKLRQTTNKQINSLWVGGGGARERGEGSELLGRLTEAAAVGPMGMPTYL